MPDSIPGSSSKETFQSPFPPKLLVARRIDVLKNDFAPDISLRLEIDDTTTYIMPVGPKLATVLVESLQRALSAVPAPTSRQ